MTITLTINDNDLLSNIDWNGLSVKTQDAMAIAYSDIVLNNFGSGSGEDRPKVWNQLSEKYAIEYHDGDRTPKLVLHGDLRSSIDVELGNPEYSSVFTNNEYAYDHQWGIVGRLHARPFFPLVNENNPTLTPYSEAKCLEAAGSVLNEFLN